MKDQVKAPVIVVAVVALVAILFFFGSKAMSAGDLDQGQVKYTPGKPPWQDPLKKGGSAAPVSGGTASGPTTPPPGAPSTGAPALGNGSR